jgi:protein-S-isoprenylcysteine O-methyltransferase Ste14
MKRFQNWAKRDYSLRQQFITLGIAGILLLLILPYLLVVLSTAIDDWLHLPSFITGVINPILGLLLIIGGIFLGMWSVHAEMTIGMGTPVPIMPTQKLVVKPPFTYCRNPMTLGTFVAYMGITIMIGSLSAMAIVLILTIILLSYVKFIEEKELEARFGVEYLEYKQNTPFIIPCVRLRP